MYVNLFWVNFVVIGSSKGILKVIIRTNPDLLNKIRWNLNQNTERSIHEKAVEKYRLRNGDHSGQAYKHNCFELLTD